MARPPRKDSVSEVKEQSDLESEATRENTFSMVWRRARLGCPRGIKNTTNKQGTRREASKSKDDQKDAKAVQERPGETSY